MKVSKASVAELKKKLPRGSARQIRTRLEEKKQSFTIQYIYRCLNPVKPDFNATIISEAILFCREHTRQVKSLQTRLEKIKHDQP